MWTLVNKPYWRRAWVIQEITTPTQDHQTMVWCGGFTISLECFLRVSGFLDSVLIGGVPRLLRNPNVESIAFLETIAAYRRCEELSSSIDLYTLLSHVHLLDTTDPRDKIYALLPLARDNEREALYPDYQRTAHQLYKDVALHFLKDGNLDILAFCGLKHNLDLPTWIPDWTVKTIPRPFQRRRLEAGSFRHLYKASLDFTAHIHIDEDMKTLHLRGFIFDSITSLTRPRYDCPQDDLDVSFEWMALSLLRWCKYVSGCTLFEAFSHTLCADVGYKKLNSTSAPDPRELFRGDSLTLHEGQTDFGIFALTHLSIDNVTLLRRLIFSSKGYMGIGPYDAEVGDELCILYGAKLPVILRKKGLYWLIVGEAYVHGIMDGEIAPLVDTEEDRILYGSEDMSKDEDNEINLEMMFQIH